MTCGGCTGASKTAIVSNSERGVEVTAELPAAISAFLAGLSADAAAFFSSGGPLAGVSKYITCGIRFALPLLSLYVLLRCARSLLSGKTEDEVWGWLSLPNGARIELRHWENIIGRAASADVVLAYPTLSRNHAALIRNADGDWKVYDLDSKSGVILRGTRIGGPEPIDTGDILSLGGVDTVFVKASADHERLQAQERERPGRVFRPAATLLALTLFALLLGFQMCISAGDKLNISVPAAFLALILILWLTYIVTRAMRRTGFEIETLAFYLCSLGFSVVAGSNPGSLYKTVLCLVMGVALFWVVGWSLRDLDRAKKMRWPLAAAGLLLLCVNVLTAESIFGERNWLQIGGISFQPSEFVKICFVFAGAATMDRLFAKRNLILFVIFSGACVGCLAMMSDFGMAAIFFATYLVVAFMRSGSFAAVLLSAGGAVFAGMIAIAAKPYIAGRFATWGKAWQYASAGGYQQTRTMSAAASGGLFGLGGGNGWLRGIFAADTDMVFGVLCEELGLIVAVCAIAAIVIMALFAIRSAGSARSSFYVIAACAAVTIFMCQVILNVFGSVDILPFTGVTFPFVSKGGSSLIASWGLLAFIKGTDTRQNASFAIRLPRRASRRGQPADAYDDGPGEYVPDDPGEDFQVDVGEDADVPDSGSGPEDDRNE